MSDALREEGETHYVKGYHYPNFFWQYPNFLDFHCAFESTIVLKYFRTQFIVNHYIVKLQGGFWWNGISDRFLSIDLEKAFNNI